MAASSRPAAHFAGPLVDPDAPARYTQGCTACGSSNTVSMDGIRGRRCALHSPWATNPPTGYDRELALALVDAGSPRSAFAYLRACITRRLWPAGRA